MHGGRPPSHAIHFHSLIPTKKRKPLVWNELCLRYLFLTAFISELQFHKGSFCLVRNPGLDGVPPEECTRDRYWKARIIEIRRPGRKNNATCSPVSAKKNSSRYHLTLYYFRNTMYWFDGFTPEMTLNRSCLRVSRL
jgi:hypothetical protein